VDALRIESFSPLLMDKSASIRVAPGPYRSGVIEIPGNPWGTLASFLAQTLSSRLDAFKFERQSLQTERRIERPKLPLKSQPNPQLKG
jgi:hypothetical protein